MRATPPKTTAHLGQRPHNFEVTEFHKIRHTHTCISSRNPIEERSAGLRHLPENTQHPKENNIHVLNSIRTSDPSNRKSGDLHFRGLKS